MRYTLDTEFFDRGRNVQLISIGIRGQDGRSFYGINADFDWNQVPQDDWLRKNVLPILHDPRVKNGPKVYPKRTMVQLKDDLTKFFSGDKEPELWGYYADYDFVLLCSIFGGMLKMPKQMPQLCLDVDQLRRSLLLTKNVYPSQEVTEQHNALNDAVWTMDALVFLLIYQQKMLDRLKLGGL